MPTIPVSPKNQVLLAYILFFFLGSVFLAYGIMKESRNDPEIITNTGSQVITTGGFLETETLVTPELPEKIHYPTSSWVKAPQVINKPGPVVKTGVVTPEKSALDFISDSSVMKFVSPEVAYIQSEYIPKDLVKIISSSSLSANSIELREEANTALVAMGKDFQEKFGEKIIIISGYRSYAYQQVIEKRAPQCVKDGLCARAGYSEHQSGLAIDLFEATTQEDFLSKPRYGEYFVWLNDYAHTYGYINTYKNWIKIDGYHEEPWHWRYVGKDFATELYLKRMSFAEYMKSRE